MKECGLLDPRVSPRGLLAAGRSITLNSALRLNTFGLATFAFCSLTHNKAEQFYDSERESRNSR